MNAQIVKIFNIQDSNIVIIKLADDMPRTKKNRQNIAETFCYLKVRLYNHEVHDFSILYETVFFACYTSQICTATGYPFSESPFLFTILSNNLNVNFTKCSSAVYKILSILLSIKLKFDH